jgi:hypothetical protein
MPRTSLAPAAAISAAVLGVLACTAGLGLLMAIGLAGAIGRQLLTAGVFVSTGVANVLASRGIWRGRGGAMGGSAVATAVVIGYSAAVLRDRGEFFWLHAAYLVLLGVLYRQRSSRPAGTA